MKKKFWLFLSFSLVCLGALFLRVYQIDKNPPSLNWDEVSHGYNAYSIFKTGKDEWGKSWPLIFRAYGDYKLPLYIYLSAPLTGLLGINAFSVRLVSVLSGLGLVIVAFLLTKKLTKSNAFALLAAFLTAVSPWSLFVSRAALEANLGAFLFALGFYFLVSWLEEKKAKLFGWTAFFWGLSLYAYNSARVLVPIMVLLVAGLVIRQKAKKQLVLGGLILTVFFLPVVGQLVTQTGSARFELVSLIDQGVVNQIIETRQATVLPKAIARAIFNRPSFFAFYTFKNYLSNLSFKYLFFYGGSHYQFSLPDHELLYLVTAPFLLLGLFQAFRGGVKEKLVFAWFFLAFIPSAITRDAPHSLRSLLVLPTPMVLTALGLKWLVEKIKAKTVFRGKFLLVTLVLCVGVSFGRWWKDYWQVYPRAYSWAWQYGYQEAVLFAKERYADYDQIIISKRYGEPHEFVLAYFLWSPWSYQNDKEKVWDYHANWYWVDGFDKFVFVNDWEIPRVDCRKNCLLITSPGNYPFGWHKIETIEFLDGETVFEILEK